MNLGYEFALVDDDPACRRMLKSIIEEEGLGHIVLEKEDGYGAAAMIEQSVTDIAIIDLLLPEEDGISIVEGLKNSNFPGQIVMLSQVETKDVVAKAYATGVDFYIQKPINRIEVISVLNRVIEGITLRRSLGKFRDLMAEIDQSGEGTINASQAKEIIKSRTQNVLSNLGVIGEAGSHDLIQVMVLLASVPDSESYLGDFRHLKNLYELIGQRYIIGKYSDSADPRAIEQRIRRAVKKGFENIAALGLENYYDPKFERYASKFFDFNEIRIKMNEMKQSRTSHKARINIRQFIIALYNEVNSS